MSKKSKNKNNKQAQGQRSLFFRDMTAERHFQTQMTKGLKLAQESKYSEALEILEPLEEKYPDRAELYEILGVIYFTNQEAAAAREAFVKALDLMPPEKRTGRGAGSASLVQFNLATSYMTSGYPLMAYETMQQVDCDNLQRGPASRLDPKTCREFSQLCDQNLTAMAEEEGLSREEFLAYGLLIEKALLALPRNQPEVARDLYIEASKLRPSEVQPYMGQSAAYTLNGQHDLAQQQLEYILDTLMPGDPAALNALIRLLVTQGKREEAESYGPKLAALPVPESAEDRIELAGAWAFLDKDQPVYDLIEPVLNSPELRQELVGPDKDEDSLSAYTEALALGVVAAAHLGKTGQAYDWFKRETEEDFTVETSLYFNLLQRTWLALEAGEEGPRPGGRFFYYDPQTLLTTAMLGNRSLYDLIRADLDGEVVEDDYQQVVNQHRQQFMEVLLYNVWAELDTENLPLLLDLVAALEMEQTGGPVPGEPVTLKRLAFGRAGNAFVRLAALAVLIRRGVVAQDEPQTIWLDGIQQTGTLEELAAIAFQGEEEEAESQL